MTIRGHRIDPYNKRAEALNAGLSTFFTGKPCVNGHESPRYTISLLCVDCKKQTFKKAYKKDKLKWLGYSSKWEYENRDRRKKYASEYRASNVDKIKDAARRYAEKNKAKRSFFESVRNARKKQAFPKWLTPKEINHIEVIYKHARHLSLLSGHKLVVDHMVPLAGKNVCGLHVPWNLQIIDVASNSKKYTALTEAAYRPVATGIMLSGKSLPWNWRNHAN